jgi:hypothetical protein
MFISPTTAQVKLDLESITPTSVDYREFWFFYFTLISLHKNYIINKNSLNILCFLMTKNPDLNYFSGEGKKELLENVKLPTTATSRPIKFLVTNGFLIQEDFGTYYLSPNLKRLKAYIDRKIENGSPLNILLNFKIENYDD